MTPTGKPPIGVDRTEPMERLRQCRLALAGLDETGAKVHPGMFDEDVISLAHGDGTRRPPLEAFKAGAEAFLDPKLCAFDDYLFLQRFLPLEARAEEIFRQGGLPPETAGNVCVECGTTRLFGAFLHCVAQPGDLFLAAPTYYHSLPDWCTCFGVSLACVPTPAENAYKLSAAALEGWYARNVETGRRPKPKGLFLFNPTQTGGIYTAEELAELARFVESHDLVVLADHVFAGTEFPGSPPAAYLAAEEGMSERVVTVCGVSKSHNLANIRIGWACGPRDVIDAMRRYSVSTIISVPRLNMVMALAALNATGEYLTENARECAARADLIGSLVNTWNDWLSERGLISDQAFRIVHPPLAGHSLLLSCAPLRRKVWPGGVIHNSADLARFFLSEAGVAVSPSFSSGLDDCEIRICFGSVGLAKTYPYSARAEAQAIAAAAGADTDRKPDPPTGPPCGREEGMFSHGRSIIRTAMLDRMLPAMSGLLSGSQPTASQPSLAAGLSWRS